MRGGSRGTACASAVTSSPSTCRAKVTRSRRPTTWPRTSSTCAMCRRPSPRTAAHREERNHETHEKHEKRRTPHAFSESCPGGATVGRARLLPSRGHRRGGGGPRPPGGRGPAGGAAARRRCCFFGFFLWL